MSDTGSSAKPLRVRVAEAMGWTACDNLLGANLWQGLPPGKRHARDDEEPNFRPIPSYDTDWSATGPLIERYGFFLRRYYGDMWFGDRWFASTDQPKPGGADTHDGPTPLIAVCNLILALHEAGKL